jgi:FlaA1/EpsC-like NDP-sugar epimerase
MEEVKTYLVNREKVISELKFENDVFICPAGNYGQMIYYFLNSDNKKKILGFLDGDTFKIGKKVYGTDMFTFKKDKVCEYDKVNVVLCVEKFRYEIKREISALNSNVKFIDI